MQANLRRAVVDEIDSIDDLLKDLHITRAIDGGATQPMCRRQGVCVGVMMRDELRQNVRLRVSGGGKAERPTHDRTRLDHVVIEQS